MVVGLSGTLLSHYFVEKIMADEFAGRLGESTLTSAHRDFRRWWADASAQLGPASSVRAIWEIATARLLEQLGFGVEVVTVLPDRRHAVAITQGERIAVSVATWDTSLDALWRDAARHAIAGGARWVVSTNGRQLRLSEAQRTFAHSYLQFELQQAADHPQVFAALWATLRSEAFECDSADRSLISGMVQASARHGQAVGRSLRTGVLEAVQHLLAGMDKCGKHDLPHIFDESLTVTYRLLFLMFAESRQLVPNWHPVYRESYTVEALRDRAERRTHARGMWEALQAISRLAHTGCRAGTLVVPAFNGRLFSPSRSPVAETCAVDDKIAREAVLALSTTRRGAGRARIDYRDLGVEQLGAVYESILEYEPARGDGGSVLLRRGSMLRKTTGSFYTPQSLTDYVVRRTLHPLVERASADRILQLRILDPSMGSGAVLVSACRYLAHAYERALVNEGEAHEADIDDADRASFKRQIAQRCLYGVDLNPAAVQVARLSLWLTTLAAHRPLTFLDHRLMCGNSLLGASVFDLARQPPGARQSRRGRADTPLFSDDDLESSVAAAISARGWIAQTADDTADIVREKERRLDRLRSTERLRSIADLWCAFWMWPHEGASPEPAVFAALADTLGGGDPALPRGTSDRLLRDAAQITERHRFFHWMLEFPEVFFDVEGRVLSNAGFDAVLGNPPWDMLRSSGPERTFFLRSGVYRYQSSGHLNRYQTFLERALMLTRRGGRIGLVLPSGFATDHSSAQLRQRLLTHTNVDTMTGFDNRRGIFPIHRGLRFLVVTATAGNPTSRIACRFGVESPAVLETIPDAADGPDPTHSVSVTPRFLEALSGEKLTIPELRSPVDLQVLERIVRNVPRLDAPDGWNVRFGRELNATDDRRHFHAVAQNFSPAEAVAQDFSPASAVAQDFSPAPAVAQDFSPAPAVAQDFSPAEADGNGLPVLEGKHIEPFRVHLDRSSYRMSERAARRLLDAETTFLRSRLAYRDVASSTNRLSLIAAILPAGVVTTHSLFCLKTKLSIDSQLFLCAMLNSYVANYLVRQVMTTHLGSATIHALRVPKLAFDSLVFGVIVDLARDATRGDSTGAAARIHALTARCYGLTDYEFAHILGTFPLIDRQVRRNALDEFRSGALLE